MQASSTQRQADHRLAAITLLAACTFAAGAALGGVAGLAAAPLTAPVTAPGAADSRTTDLSAPAFRMHRDGEISPDAAAFGPEDNGLRLQRAGEISADTGSTGGSLGALPRYDVSRGK